jgi:archaellum component FlaC
LKPIEKLEIDNSKLNEIVKINKIIKNNIKHVKINMNNIQKRLTIQKKANEQFDNQIKDMKHKLEEEKLKMLLVVFRS